MNSVKSAVSMTFKNFGVSTLIDRWYLDALIGGTYLT